jgi:hypothetical protein
MNTEGESSMFNNKEEPIEERGSQRVSKKNKLTNNNDNDNDEQLKPRRKRPSKFLTVPDFPKLKINWTNTQCSIASNETSETVTAVMTGDSVGNTIGNNESTMKKNLISMLAQMSHEFIESAVWRDKIMNEKEKWIRDVCEKSGLMKAILRLSYLEDRCRDCLKVTPSVLFLSIRNPENNTYVVYEENAPGSISYLNDNGYIVGLCSSALDHVELHYKNNKFARPLQMQKELLDKISRILENWKGAPEGN